MHKTPCYNCTYVLIFNIYCIFLWFCSCLAYIYRSFVCFSASIYSSGGFWSGSCLYSAYFSAICSRLC